MSLRSYSFLRRIHKIFDKRFSTAVEVSSKDEQTTQICSFRTTENNPANHTTDHLARLYTIPTNVYEQLFGYFALPLAFKSQVNTFQECSLLIRQPAVEIISYLKQTDYTRPPNKFVLYGKFGTGKSISLVHIVHYAFMEKFILVHVWPTLRWMKAAKEVTNSVLSPGCMDLPIDAGIWLKHFKCQNLTLLQQLDLKTSKDYIWNQHESTSQGSPILELINFGINRIKYACGVVNALMEEIKLASTAGKCRTIVIIEGFNALTSKYTRVFDDNKNIVLPHKITLAIPFLDMIKSNWCNGAIVVTVDERASKEHRESYLPKYLLGKEGFEFMDPFVPILVENYTDAEFDSMIEYYKDRKWIRNITPDGQKELELISNKNPLALLEQCKFL